MMPELVEAITNKFKADGLEVREVAFQDLIDQKINLTRPAVNVLIQTGTWEQVTLTAYKVQPEVRVMLVFQHLRAGVSGDERRRSGVYRIAEAVFQSLILQDFDLDLENPLLPVAFRDITTRDLIGAGILVYEMTYSCSFIVEYQDPRDQDQGYLNTLLAQYYLQPRDYTGMIGVTGPEASDLIVTATGIGS